MNWLRWNWIGLLGLSLAVVALVLGTVAFRSAVQRDEQTRGIALRLKRDEADLAERHRRAASALGGIADALRPVTFSTAALAVAVGLWHTRDRRRSLWWTGATAIIVVGAVALAHASRAGPTAESPPLRATGQAF